MDFTTNILSRLSPDWITEDEILYQNILPICIGGVLTLIITYYTVKICYSLYRLLFCLFVYKPKLKHLERYERQKLQQTGKVRRKNGSTEVQNNDFVPPAVPNGWFYVMLSSELQKEEVLQVSMCELELAVFRDTHGYVHALDAFCPHLGANLAVGGKVRGSCLECPFHAWKWNGEDGKCVDIPGAKKIPEKAKIKTWPVLEMNGVILLWHDAEDRDPLFMPKEIEELYHENWTVHCKAEHIVHCHISEIPENGADIAHFIPVHAAVLSSGSDLEGINKSESTTINHKWSSPSWYADKSEWFVAHGELFHDLAIMNKIMPFTRAHAVFDQIGPGIVHLQPHGVPFSDMIIVQYVIPLEMFKVKVIHIALAPKGLRGRLAALFALWAEITMVERDMVLWNHKVFKGKPLLASTKSDELLVKFRRWYSQFYSLNQPEKAKTDLSW